MVTGLLISERAAARKSELLDDARTARLVRRARDRRRDVGDRAFRAPTPRGWLRSAPQTQSD
ncbi:MAG TPA: hypothetical protein VF218_00110 [Acidothermaceae bacterium]|jgi:hypothetical protein